MKAAGRTKSMNGSARPSLSTVRTGTRWPSLLRVAPARKRARMPKNISASWTSMATSRMRRNSLFWTQRRLNSRTRPLGSSHTRRCRNSSCRHRRKSLREKRLKNCPIAGGRHVRTHRMSRVSSRWPKIRKWCRARLFYTKPRCFR